MGTDRWRDRQPDCSADFVPVKFTTVSKLTPALPPPPFLVPLMQPASSVTRSTVNKTNSSCIMVYLNIIAFTDSDLFNSEVKALAGYFRGPG